MIYFDSFTIYHSIRKIEINNICLMDRTCNNIQAQTQKVFWIRDGSERSQKVMKPDIVITKEGQMVVLDTKWKNIGDDNPSDNDLRQMYAYSRFYKNAKTALVYPCAKNAFKAGTFQDDIGATCGIMKLKVENNVKTWQERIAQFIFDSELFTPK